MPRAEVGSTKYIANQMKSKGLQRLRWYCQACQRQMRDENGFKCHVASESHVRNMHLIGEDPHKAINDFSRQFERDFLQLLRTGHGEKKVNLNHFYQEYIANKEHIHMNSTKWPSLTEFAKHLEEQIRRARRDGLEAEQGEDDTDLDGRNEQGIRWKNGEKVVLNFSKRPTEPENLPTPPPTDKTVSPGHEPPEGIQGEKADPDAAQNTPLPSPSATDPVASKPRFKPLLLSTSKPKNVFAALSKKNALGGSKKPNPFLSSKPMSEAERIMKEELERKRRHESNGMGAPKKQRFS
ncbi:hypothetical protein DV736_g773, partial [Chaetothyriales sp. CBS 134916]